MKAYATQSIRNVGIAGHGDTGKTQLVSSLLFTAGMTTRLGKVAEGNTVTDWDEEEIARKITIHTSLAYAEWAPSRQAGQAEKIKINFLDTPGYSTFLNDTRASLVAADAVLIVVDALAGVQVVTEKVWDYATEYDVPRAFAINWMDRELANYDRAMESITRVFGRNVVPLQLPIGAEKTFRGVVDLITMKAHVYTPDGDGKPKIEEIPADLAEAAKVAHETLVEMVAEGDDALMEEFFEKGTLPIEDLRKGLREAFQAKRIYPVVLTSALHNIGSATLLDLLAEMFPDPSQRGTAIGHSETASKGDEVQRKIGDAEPLSIFVFKTLADPFSGRISYFKVMSGVLKNDAMPQNFTRGTSERLQHIQVMQGKTPTAVPELHAGDLGTVAKLKETFTGDTLGDKAAPIHYPLPHVPEPSITFAVEPKTRADEDRIGPAIHQHSGRRPVAAFFARPADQGVSPGGLGPAAHRGGRRQAAQALSRGPDAAPAQGALPRNDSRQGRRRRQAQEADRRPRPVRRLPRSPGAGGARDGHRIRGRHFRRRDPQELDSVGRERHPRFGRARAISPVSLSWISAPSSTTANITTWTAPTWRSRSPGRSRSRKA